MYTPTPLVSSSVLFIHNHSVPLTAKPSKVSVSLRNQSFLERDHPETLHFGIEHADQKNVLLSICNTAALSTSYFLLTGVSRIRLFSKG